ncbi:hypothetical protein UFOVP1383_49 [uncultured Caudovirales phage]|uniref:Uncharacterized protein n=1 Tax=uncultured Caudovirales phage TaxID=2100421 RepID=A0A6J5PUM8_9CAUD|nr:hypothetical protein UFOVP848_51 [uncultured Caudovirales phage]CAB4173061.1 hypothetical protein UFOVP945_14 [uncultured Caudovirales phage]CAB4179639.1 hypothetical protein UFOVP1023_28 [uncultured Caudovirales phage]CAB4204295.1 hypothetical protein UFOVP1383_49 [uncultured Caudovirales phage]CAB4216090.1 hypothetical protein UFOVP1477_58 [uncultured Caudovirales phage]
MIARAALIVPVAGLLALAVAIGDGASIAGGAAMLVLVGLVAFEPRA